MADVDAMGLNDVEDGADSVKGGIEGVNGADIVGVLFGDGAARSRVVRVTLSHACVPQRYLQQFRFPHQFSLV